MDKKWKIALTVLVIVSVVSLAGIYVFVLSRPQQLLSNSYNPLSGEIDATTVVSSVIDGDTFDTTSEGRIRLADIDAPEYWESGYDNAKNFLISLIDDKTVYLDIDDKYETDKYGRKICVVYVSHNSTHLKNVNEALVVSGHVVIDDYDNEFSPYAWSLYCQNQKQETTSNQDQNTNQNPPPTQEFVGSKNSDVYHYPSCYWAKQIKSGNRVWFTSSADAKAHGYRACKVCKPP